MLHGSVGKGMVVAECNTWEVRHDIKVLLRQDGRLVHEELLNEVDGAIAENGGHADEEDHP